MGYDENIDNIVGYSLQFVSFSLDTNVVVCQDFRNLTLKKNFHDRKKKIQLTSYIYFQSDDKTHFISEKKQLLPCFFSIR